MGVHKALGELDGLMKREVFCGSFKTVGLESRTESGMA